MDNPEQNLGCSCPELPSVMDLMDAWEITGVKDPEAFFREIVGLLPAGSLLCVEVSSPSPGVRSRLTQMSVPSATLVRRGTLCPSAELFHVPVNTETMAELASLAADHAVPEYCNHLHAYRANEILLSWYDAFSDAILVSGVLDEEKVRAFSSASRVAYRNVRPGA